MFARFGEVEAESSRAFPEDECDQDEDDISSQIALMRSTEIKSQTVRDRDFENRVINDGLGHKLYFLDDDESYDENIADPGMDISCFLGESYEAFEQETIRTPSSNLLCVFNGRAPVGFGKGHLDNSAPSLAKIYFTGNQGTVDSLLKRPNSKLVVEVVRADSNLLFALVDTYAVPSSVINAVCAELKIFIEASHQVVIFHSEELANFVGELDNFIETKIFHIKNELFNPEDIPTVSKPCPNPNILSGISGTILTMCQQIHKRPCLILANYTPTEIVNPFTMQPFFDVISQDVPKKLNLDISAYFSKLHFQLTSTGSSVPTYISQSNLYT